MTDDQAESSIRLADLMALIEQLQKANAALQSRVADLEQNQKHLTKLVRTLEVNQEVFSQTHSRKKSTDSMKIKSTPPPIITEDPDPAPSPTVESFAQSRETHLTRSTTIQNLLEELAKEAAASNTHTWAEVNASRVDLKSLSKSELARQEAIHALITSEEMIVRDLTLLRDIYMKRLKESNLLTNDQFAVIFSNLVQVLSVNRNFLEVITDKAKATLTFGHISECFSQMNAFLKAYGTYCQNHPSSTLTLTQVRKNEKIRFLLTVIKNDIPEVKQSTLEVYLMKPILRVSNYPVLLGEILKHTEKDSPDFNALAQLKEKFELLLFQAFRATPKFDEAQKVLLAQAIIDSEKPLNLLSAKRSFIHEGMVQKHDMIGKKELYFVLFSDLLLICRPNGHSKVHFRLKESVPAELFMALDSDESEHKPIFQLHFPGKDKLTIECGTMEDKATWLRMFADLNSSQNIRSVEDKGTKKKSGLKLWASTFANQAEGIEDPEKNKESMGASIIRRSKTLTQRVSTDVMASLIRRRKQEPDEQKDGRPTSQKAADSYTSLPDDPSKNVPKDWQPPTSNLLRNLDAANMQPKKRLSTVIFDPTHPLPDLPHPKTVNNNIEDLYISSEAFVARTPYEISFDVGAELLVVNSDREDFWKVEMKGIFGYAPSSFLDPSPLENYDLVEAINKLKFERTSGCRTCRADPRIAAEETEISQPPPLEERKKVEHKVLEIMVNPTEKEKEKEKEKKKKKSKDDKPDKEKKKSKEDKEKRRSSKNLLGENGELKPKKKKLSQSTSMGEIAAIAQGDHEATKPLESHPEEFFESQTEIVNTKDESDQTENTEKETEKLQEPAPVESEIIATEQDVEKNDSASEPALAAPEQERGEPDHSSEPEPKDVPQIVFDSTVLVNESMEAEPEFFDAQDGSIQSQDSPQPPQDQ